MGYLLRAFIGHTTDLQGLATHCPQAVLVEVGQDLALIPMTEAFYEELTANRLSPEITPFFFLTRAIEERVLALLGPVRFGYLEAEYFGGRGSQFAVLWQGGQHNVEPSTINTVLQKLGVVSTAGRDEFDTLGLGRPRETEEWVNT
jgi:hypothetical protein